MIPYKKRGCKSYIGQYHKVTDVGAADFADLGCEASSASRTPDGIKADRRWKRGVIS